MIWFRNVVALPGGEAVVYKYTLYNNMHHVLKIDSQEKLSSNIYTCVGCAGIECLLVLGELLHISHQNYNIIETRVSDGLVMNIFTIADFTLCFKPWIFVQ